MSDDSYQPGEVERDLADVRAHVRNTQLFSPSVTAQIDALRASMHEQPDGIAALLLWSADISTRSEGGAPMRSTTAKKRLSARRYSRGP